MLWSVMNEPIGCTLLIEADSAVEGEAWAKRITRCYADWTVRLAVALDQVEALELIDRWWGEYCDMADDNACISDAEFDAVCGRMNDSIAAVYTCCPD